ncbi:PAS domain-containing protein [Spirochaeta isovalerica]|uniref:histidine kinase n=1 Tax=Spirochaeta isovalerica TaxID=150 RepID=A0A841RDJ1_9SPIO|nr:PAS domain S-box protein [Spirochaeta isovalerica]MBB6481696.1 PAS domain S-box-containing protein [Spirochaeta isovalerica]
MGPEKKTLLFLTEKKASVNVETKALAGAGFAVVLCSSKEDVIRRLEEERILNPLVIIGLTGKNPAEWVDSERAIHRFHNTPLLYYTKEADSDFFRILDQSLHNGIVPAEAGSAFLIHSIEKFFSRKHEVPFRRFINIVKETNHSPRQDQYGFLIAGLVDAIIVDSKEGQIIEVNNKACRILELSRDQMIEGQIYKSGWTFIHEDLTPFPIKEHPHLIAREKKESVNNIIMGINRPGKETLWLSSSSIPVISQENGELEGVITSFRDISEYVSIRKDNLRMAAIFTHADWGVAMGSANTDTIEKVNPAYARMHGYEPEEMTGLDITSVFAPEERKKIPRHIKIACERGHHRFEASHLKKDGTVFPTINALTIIYDHEGNPLFRAVNVVDLTEMKKKENQLREAKEYSEILFNNSPIAIYSVDKEGKIVDFNQQAEEITGFKKEEVIGRHLDLVREELLSETVLASEFKITTRDNEEKIIERYSSELCDFNGSAIGEVNSFIDITEWKRLEEYKSDIERIIRHDLKTPLNSIIGFPKLMLTDENLSDEYREYLMIIFLAGQNMLNLINASLNLYRLEQGSYNFSMEKIELITILKQIRKTLRDECSRKKNNIRIELNSGPLERDYEIDLMTEKSFIFMILLNLAKNAVEASPIGEDVIISIKKGDQLEISIHNKGAVPESVREHFFEKNYTYGKKHGNGLGTYSAKLMANALGADLTFTTDDTEGTTLFLKL